jgi:retron-type reverse transcriptase
MENLSENQKPQLSTDNSKLETWENIPKVKWDGLPKQEDVNQLIKQNQTLIKSKPLIVIEAIQKRIATQISNNQEITPIANIYDLLCHPDILRIAYSKIKGNKGALTPGTDPNTSADTFAEEQIRELSLKLKTGRFKWKSVRRIMIDKPEKKEKRPLGLPDFDDKVVQCAILLILEAAYENEFEKLNCNFGFRPNKDTNSAMEKINLEARFYQFGVEGDIDGAYNNVQHKILLENLSERFTDKKFLNLIQKGLECGYMLDFQTYPTLLGTPQGSICSPILFNIYMQPFDKYVQTEMLNELQINQNTPQPELKTRSQESNPHYEKVRSKKRNAQSRLKEFQEVHNRDLKEMPIRRFVEFYRDFCPYTTQVLNQKHPDIKKAADQTLKANKLYIAPKSKEIGEKYRDTVLQNTTLEEKEILKEEYENYLKSIFLENRKEQKTTKYLNPASLKKKLTYVRYADDWIIFVRGEKTDADKVKELAAKFLKEKLGLTLSENKTKITDLYKNKANFLGFEIFYQRNKLNKKVNKGSDSLAPITQRFGTMQFLPDVDRLKKRFILKKYMTKNDSPKEVGFLTVLQDHEIITKYNQFMLGLGNYYIRQIAYPSALCRWFYILYYSCIKTLATKHKTTVKDIIKTYGHLDLSNPTVNKLKPAATDLRIIADYKRNNKKQYVVLLNYKEIMFQLQKIKDKYIEEKKNNLPHQLVREADMLTLHKVNLRTAFKETSLCAVCGKKEKTLHNHHIKHLKWKKNPNIKGYKGFDKIVAALGRKQIPVCIDCHQKIHAGKYNGMALNEIYDVRLVAPEGLLKFSTQNPINPSQNLNQKKEEKIIIDEYHKTYLNRELQFFLKKR